MASSYDVEMNTSTGPGGGTQGAIEHALWGEADASWSLGNANALDFLQEVPPEHTLQLAYEDLVTAPQAGPGRYCLPYYLFPIPSLDGGTRVRILVRPHCE